MRVAIYRCDLKNALSLFGSRREEIIKSLQDKLRQKIAEEDYLSSDERESYVVRGANIIARAVLEGVPFVGLEQESDIHNIVVQLLTEMAQQSEATNFDDWKRAAFCDFGEEYSHQLQKQSQTYLYYFQEGRPLCGKTCSDEGRYYGYLTKEETVFLLNELVEFQEQEPELADGPFSEFVDTWISALDEIAIAGKDLWFWAE